MHECYDRICISESELLLGHFFVQNAFKSAGFFKTFFMISRSENFFKNFISHHFQ